MSSKSPSDEFNAPDVCFLFLGKSPAGFLDLERFRRLFPKAQFATRNDLLLTGLPEEISKQSRSYVYIHSSPYNLMIRLLHSGREHILLVHNPPGFSSRTGMMGLLDNLILKLNITLSNRLAFLSEHVLKKYQTIKDCFLITKKDFVVPAPVKKRTGTLPTVFFFGRYLPYKNVEIFCQLAKENRTIEFYVYSEGCPVDGQANLYVRKDWLSDGEVDRIYAKHDILILPYKNVSQSGPLFLGFEKGLRIVVPNLQGFEEYRGLSNVYLYSASDTNALQMALRDVFREWKEYGS